MLNKKKLNTLIFVCRFLVSFKTFYFFYCKTLFINANPINFEGEIIMHGSYKGLDEVVGPLAEKLFDQIPIVRRTVAEVAARWMIAYRDRYSFFHKIIPLLLTG